MRRILVCGGRDFVNTAMLDYYLDRLLRVEGVFVLVHGAAPGADRMAARWAQEYGLPIEPHPAKWKQYGKAAGAIRNQEMLDSGVDGVVAFPGGTGTNDMVQRATAAGVLVWDLRRG